MELMEGESLATRLDRVKRMAAPETASIVSQAARALVRAHEAGIVHRDLKPDNIFLIRNEDEEIAKVLDFGIAKSKAHAIGGDAATRTGSVLGTPYYMSPEQISGSKELDYRTDLWALAVIAYEMLTGQRPYTADTVGGLAIEICTRRPRPPSSHAPVPVGFDAWFDRATALDPANRYGSARELAEDLRRVCGSSSGRLSHVDSGTRSVVVTGGRSLGAVTNTTRPGDVDVAQRRQVWRLAVAAGTIIVAGLIAASWLSRSPEIAPAATVSIPPADEVKAQEPKALAAPPPAVVPTEPPPAVDLPSPAPPAEVPRYDPPAKIDVAKNVPRVRDEAQRKGVKKGAPAAKSPASTAAGNDSLPDNGSLLDDRK
jgi:serine/threonine-protein kinase